MSVAIAKPNSSEITDKSSSPFLVTDAAACKIHELLEAEGDPNLHLRISIKGGGCSGLKYEFLFDEADPEEDIKVKKETVSPNPVSIEILVHMLSLPYLKGATLDYKNDVDGERFIIINNPNVKSTCGCGASFDG